MSIEAKAVADLGTAFDSAVDKVGTNTVAASLIDFDSDAPLVCTRNQEGDETCESCQ